MTKEERREVIKNLKPKGKIIVKSTATGKEIDFFYNNKSLKVDRTQIFNFFSPEKKLKLAIYNDVINTTTTETKSIIVSPIDLLKSAIDQYDNNWMFSDDPRAEKRAKEQKNKINDLVEKAKEIGYNGELILKAINLK